MHALARCFFVILLAVLTVGWTWPWGKPELSSLDECLQEVAQPASGAAQRRGLAAACRMAHGERSELKDFSRCLLRGLPASNVQSAGRRVVNDCALRTKPPGNVALTISHDIFPTVEEIAQQAREEAAKARADAARAREESERERREEARRRDIERTYRPSVGSRPEGPTMMTIDGKTVMCMRIGAFLDCN